MKISTSTKTLIVAFATLPAMVGAVTLASAGNDPTRGRIQNRQAQNTAQYHECAGFALRVFQGAMSQAGNNSAKIRAARSHYHANLGRCRARYL